MLEEVQGERSSDGERVTVYRHTETGKLHILNHRGTPLHEVNLPIAYGSPDWNGGLAAPTLANIDEDPDVEIVLNTAHSGFVAYDLPGTENARILWGTGRGNYQRTGSVLHGSLRTSRKTVHPVLPAPGDVLTYTVLLKNTGPILPTARVTDTIAPEVHHRGNLYASSGTYGEASGVITWAGSVASGIPITITYSVTVGAQITAPHVLSPRATIDDGRGNIWHRQATTIVNGRAIYLPTVLR